MRVLHMRFFRKFLLRLKKKLNFMSYLYVEKNIYKTGGVYRVRVGQFSGYALTLKKARKLRTLQKLSNRSLTVI